MPATRIRKMLQQRALENAKTYHKITSLFHRSFSCLRLLPHFRLTTPRLSLLDGKHPCQAEEQVLDFPLLLKLLGLRKSSFLENLQRKSSENAFEVPKVWKLEPKTCKIKEKPTKNRLAKRLQKHLKPHNPSKFSLSGPPQETPLSCDFPGEDAKTPSTLIIGEFSAICYQVLASKIQTQWCPRTVLVVCNDFLDDFSAKIRFYEGFLEGKVNFLLVLFNYPCQPYTLYSEKISYNNEYLAMVLDLLLYRLSKDRVIHIRSDNLLLLGTGLGANVALTFRK